MTTTASAGLLTAAVKGMRYKRLSNRRWTTFWQRAAFHTSVRAFMACKLDPSSCRMARSRSGRSTVSVCIILSLAKKIQDNKFLFVSCTPLLCEFCAERLYNALHSSPAFPSNLFYLGWSRDLLKLWRFVGRWIFHFRARIGRSCGATVSTCHQE